MPRRATPPHERFWDKVPERPSRGCWPWYGARDQHGFGRLSAGKRGEGWVKAHRLSWEIKHGPIRDGLWVLHRCPNYWCVNPAHLFLGTNSDRMKHLVATGRTNAARGIENGRAKLTDEQVEAIRVLSRKGYARVRLARFFGVAECTITSIVNGTRRQSAPGLLPESKAA